MGKFWTSWFNILCLAAGKGMLIKHKYRQHFQVCHDRRKVWKCERYKVKGEHFHPKNYSFGCQCWLQFKLLIDLMFECLNQFTPNGVDRHRSAFYRSQKTQLFVLSQTACHFHCLAGNSIIIFNNPALSTKQSSLTVSLQLS